MRRTALALAAVAVLAAAAHAPAAELVGRAVLPADTFAPGPPSGALIGPGPFNGVTPPFPGQPVQGFSAVLPAGRGQFWAMSDNGYGAKANSGDFLLRAYRIDPRFETARDGSGRIRVKGFIQLRDAHGPLTGADYDIESFRRERDGTLWFGDEFGPFLLHTSARGSVLGDPIPLPGVKSPDNPTLGSETPNLPSSRGFEGMAISPDRKTLYPMLEGGLTTDPEQRRRFIYKFDLRRERYESRRWQYRMEDPAHAIGDLTALDRHRLIVIERDNLQGAAAAFKRMYLVDLRRTDGDGFLRKRELVDLLEVRDPAGISLPGRPGDIGMGDPFAFPFQTIESVLPLSASKLLVLNDNNYPFSNGRNPERPDDEEAIVVRVRGLR